MFVGIGFISKAQLQPPLPPTFEYLTLDLNTGNPTLFWTKPNFDPLRENPQGYIIQKDMFVNGLWTTNEPFDTVGPTVFTYTDITANGNISRVRYSIKSQSIDPTKSSQQTSNHSSIFITSFYDSCNHKIDLRWLQYNEGWGNKIDSNFVYVGNTPDWTTFTKLYSLKGTIDKISLLNVVENQDYYVYVVSKKLGTPAYYTKSNLYHRYTKMPVLPAYMSIDSVLAEDNKVNLYFKIDPTTGLDSFNIVRWEQPDSILSLYSTKVLHSFTNPAKTYYADTVDSWAARTRPFYYKIDALNSCPKVVKITNHANSIPPVVHNDFTKNHIQWDALFIDKSRINQGNHATYRVIRYAYKDIPDAPFYLPETDLLETPDDVTSFEGQGYKIEFCYQVEAFERNASNDIVMYSRSRKLCTEVVPGVIMPNAIVPNDFTTSNSGNSRNILVPIIKFKANYTLSIYNRYGSLVFSKDNEGWNGREANGRFVKEGAYIYRLVVHAQGNNSVIKTGNVTVVYK